MNTNQTQARSGPPGLDGDSFREKFNSTVCSIDCQIAGKGDSVSSWFEGTRLGAFDVLRYDGYGIRGGRRNVCHIREKEIDDFLVILPLTSPMVISQSGRSAVVEPGMCTLMTTRKPFEGLCGGSSSDLWSEVMVRMPGSLLRQQVPFIDECCAIPISAKRGAGKVMYSLIENLAVERNDYSELQAKRFGTLLLGVVANVALETPELDFLKAECPSQAHAQFFRSANDFIETNLSNPKLDPAMVAYHCRISVSYLHAAFAASSLSVGAHIRNMRLQRCREAILNPSLRGKSITEIAFRWGFDSFNTFYRGYRSRFGKSPSEDRKMSRLDGEGLSTSHATGAN